MTFINSSFRWVAMLVAVALVAVACNTEPEPMPATADFSPSATTVAVGEAVTFANSSIGVGYQWSFGDGNTSTDQSPTHTYTAIGTYTVTLIVTGEDGGSASATADITVRLGASLFFMDPTDGKIARVDVSGSTPAVDQDTIALDGFGVGFTIDPATDVIYYVDADVIGDGKIFSVNLDGTGKTELYTGLNEPTNIVVVGSDLYWTDRGDGFANELDGAIFKGSTTGGGTPSTVLTGQDLPQALAYADGKLYFSDVSEPAEGEKIYSVNVDGSGLTTIIDGAWGYSLTVNDGKVYYGDQASFSNDEDNTISRANLDGSGVEVLANQGFDDAGGYRTYGIAVDASNGKLYWAEREAGTIYRANLDGSGKETIASGLSSPRALFFYN